jgi:hypothetical protein
VNSLSLEGKMVGSKSDRMTKSLPTVESKATGVQEGELLWTPSATQVEDANLTRFAKWLRRKRGLEFDSYDAMWHRSVTELEKSHGPDLRPSQQPITTGAEFCGDDFNDGVAILVVTCDFLFVVLPLLAEVASAASWNGWSA